MSDDLDPEPITAQLLTRPTRCWKKGDSISTSTGLGEASSGGWFLYSDTVQSDNVSDHLAWLARELGPISEHLQRMRIDGYWVDLCCNLSGENPVGFILQAEVLAAVAKLGLELDFTVDLQSE